MGGQTDQNARPAAEAPRGGSRPPRRIPGMSPTTAGALAAEVLGTYLLVFIGTGTLLATQQLTGGPMNATAISLAFGFAVLIAVYALGHLSGAHINPSVTIGLAAVRRFPWSAVPGYLAAQLGGALLAALTNWVLFGDQARQELLLGATTPGERGPLVALLAEFVITFLLLVTVLAVAVDERSPGPTVAGLAIGFVIAAAIFVTLPVSGGSLNAARTFGPMIVAAQFPGWWVYLIGPAAGGIAGAATWEFLLRRGQPPGAGRQQD
jgi:MIP family channel proteins